MNGRQDLCDHLPGGTHRLDFCCCLYLDHGSAPPFAV